jgi:protein phosphatase
MATTAVGIVAIEQYGAPYWMAFNIGDSRLYRSGEAGLEQVSVDHSYVQELVDSGRLSPAEARRHPERSVITCALGVEAAYRPDFWLFPAEPGQRFLLCSDGLTDEVGDADISALLARADHPQIAADALVAAALHAGAADNVSVIVVDVRANPADSGMPGDSDETTALTVSLDDRTQDSDHDAETATGQPS